MPKVKRKKKNDGHDYVGQLFNLLEDMESWSHGGISALEIERDRCDIIKLRVSVLLWMPDGSQEYKHFYFYAYRHIELAARKAVTFIQELDKELDAKKDVEREGEMGERWKEWMKSKS